MSAKTINLVRIPKSGQGWRAKFGRGCGGSTNIREALSRTRTRRDRRSGRPGQSSVPSSQLAPRSHPGGGFSWGFLGGRLIPAQIDTRVPRKRTDVLLPNGYIDCYTDCMRKPGRASVQPRTIADLRREFGPSQSMFAQLCGLTQAQVSMLENGKVEQPRDGTIRKISDACGIDETLVQELLDETRNRLTDENLSTYYQLEQSTRDLYARTHDMRRRSMRDHKIAGELYPRANESARLNLAAQALALGRRAHDAAAANRQVNWLALGGVANELYREVDAGPWQQDPDLAVSRGAFQLVRDMCRDFDERQEPQVRRWLEALRNLINDASEASANAMDWDIRWIGTDLLAIAMREPDVLVTGVDEFSSGWSNLVFSAADADRELSPIQMQVSAVANLLKGVRHGVEDRRAPMLH